VRFLGITSLLSLIFAVAPGAVAAQSGAVPSDPDANSPSGVVYELPLDQARKDAAPRKTAGAKHAARDPARSQIAIRSENNFGSSSRVPGVSGHKRRHSGAAAASGGSGSGGSGGDGKAAGLAAHAASPASASGPSDGVVVPLVICLLAVGAAIGVFAGHRTLRRRGI
jgi:hypothetical protein